MTENNAKDFDLLDFVKGRSRAKDEVVLYMDENAAKEVSKHLEYTKDADGNLRAIGVLPEHDEEYKKAKEALEASAITIHLRGAPEGRVQELRDEFEIVAGADDNDPHNEESWKVAVLIEQYQKTVTADGRESTTPLTSEQWFEFKENAPRSQWEKLLFKVLELVYVSVVIDDSTDAGFLANS